jgi:hypothetical protein
VLQHARRIPRTLWTVQPERIIADLQRIRHIWQVDRHLGVAPAAEGEGT